MTPLQAALWEDLAAIPGMDQGDSVFSDGPALWVNAKQVAHFIDATSLELRLTKPIIRERRDALRSDVRVELRPRASDWIIVRFECLQDFPFVLEMARLAAEAHMAPEGAPRKLPPMGADLERRRRFH